MDYGVGRYPVGQTTQRKISYNTSDKRAGTSYLQETKAELRHFKQLNPAASVSGLLIKGASKLIDIAVIAPFKIVHRLLF